MRLVDRVTELDPCGGRFGVGLIRGEHDILPDAWFLTCHFIDDQVMPGTLMYECGLHTLRIFLLRIGWVGEKEAVAWEPVPDIASRLKCRGQVTAATRRVTYEVTIKERGYRPEPYVIVDALMYADDKPIVEIVDMSLRLTGQTRAGLARCGSTHDGPAPLSPVLRGEGLGVMGEPLSSVLILLPSPPTLPPGVPGRGETRRRPSSAPSRSAPSPTANRPRRSASATGFSIPSA